MSGYWWNGWGDGPHPHPVVRLEFSVSAGQRVAVGPYEVAAGTGAAYVADWGDGTSTTFSGSDLTSGEIRPEHVYASAGRYVASFEVAATFSLMPSSFRFGTAGSPSAEAATSDEDAAGALALTDIVSLEVPAGLTLELLPGAFRSCPRLEGVVGSRVNPAAVEGTFVAGPRAFRGCGRLTGLADGLLAVFDKAVDLADGTPAKAPLDSMFERCRSLRSVPLGHGPDTGGAEFPWGASCFEGCTALTGLSAPPPDFYNEVTLRGREFFGCTSLRGLDFLLPAMALRFWRPSGVDNAFDAMRLGAVSCFEGCSSLSDISALGRANWVGDRMELPARAFFGCRSLVSLSGLTDPLYGVRYSAAAFGDECFRGTSLASLAGVPSCLYHAGRSCFEGLETLLSADLSGTSATVGDRAFANCVRLRTASISGGIGEEAFAGCYLPPVISPVGEVLEPADGLRTVSVPDSVARAVPVGAFDGCALLQAVPVPSSMPAGTSYSAGARAFRGCASVASVAGLPARGASLGESCFEGCSSLVDAHVRMAGWTVSTVPRKLFKGCSSAPVLPLSPYTSAIGDEAYAECSSATAPGGDEWTVAEAAWQAAGAPGRANYPPPAGSFLSLCPQSTSYPGVVIGHGSRQPPSRSYSLVELAAPVPPAGPQTSSRVLPGLGKGSFKGCAAHGFSDLTALSSRIFMAGAVSVTPSYQDLAVAFGLPTSLPDVCSASPGVERAEVLQATMPDLSRFTDVASKAAAYGWTVLKFTFSAAGEELGSVYVLVWVDSISAPAEGQPPQAYLCPAEIGFGSRVLTCDGALSPSNPDFDVTVSTSAESDHIDGSDFVPGSTDEWSPGGVKVTVSWSGSSRSSLPVTYGECGTGDEFSAAAYLAWDVITGITSLTSGSYSDPLGSDKYTLDSVSGYPTAIEFNPQMYFGKRAPLASCSATDGNEVCYCSELVTGVLVNDDMSGTPLLAGPDTAGRWVRSLLGFYASIGSLLEPLAAPFFSSLSISPAMVAWRLSDFLTIARMNPGFRVPDDCFAGAAGPANLMPKYTRLGRRAFEGSSVASVSSESRLDVSVATFRDAASLEEVPLLRTTAVPDECFAGASSLSDFAGLSPTTRTIGPRAFAGCSRFWPPTEGFPPVRGVSGSVNTVADSLASLVSDSGFTYHSDVANSAVSPAWSHVLPVKRLGDGAFAGITGAACRFALSPFRDPSYITSVRMRLIHLEDVMDDGESHVRDLAAAYLRSHVGHMTPEDGDTVRLPAIVELTVVTADGGRYVLGVSVEQDYTVSVDDESDPPDVTVSPKDGAEAFHLANSEVLHHDVVLSGLGGTDGPSGTWSGLCWSGNWAGVVPGGPAFVPRHFPFTVCGYHSDGVPWHRTDLLGPGVGQANWMAAGSYGWGFMDAQALDALFAGTTGDDERFSFVVRSGMTYYSIVLTRRGLAEGTGANYFPVACEPIRPLICDENGIVAGSGPIPVFPLLEEIGDGCFEGSRLAGQPSSWLPPTVTRLPARCFADANFTEVDEIRIRDAQGGFIDAVRLEVPNSVVSIGDECFAGCRGGRSSPDTNPLCELVVSSDAWQEWVDRGVDGAPWGVSADCSVIVGSSVVWGPYHEYKALPAEGD